MIKENNINYKLHMNIIRKLHVGCEVKHIIMKHHKTSHESYLIQFGARVENDNWFTGLV